MTDLDTVFIVVQYAYNKDNELYCVMQHAFTTREGADVFMDETISKGKLLVDDSALEYWTQDESPYLRHIDMVTGDADYLRYCVVSLPDIPETKYYLTLTVVGIE